MMTHSVEQHHCSVGQCCSSSKYVLFRVQRETPRGNPLAAEGGQTFPHGGAMLKLFWHLQSFAHCHPALNRHSVCVPII